MILLDTNVISAVMAKLPPAPVVRWLDAQDTPTLYISSISIAEIRYGIRCLPAGKRQVGLEARFASFVEQGFDQRVLSFDASAADRYGDLMASRRTMGRPMSVLDGQIAAIARAHRAAVATRNIRDFEACGVDLIDPFVPS